MANGISSFASGIQSGATGGTGLAILSTNTRARTPMGMVGLSTDVVIFAAGTGKWFFANQRVRVSGVATITATSFGQAIEAQQTGSMSVIMADQRVEGM